MAPKCARAVKRIPFNSKFKRMSECQPDDGQNKQDAGWSRAEKKKEKRGEKRACERASEVDRGRVKNSGYAPIFLFVFHRSTPIDLDPRVNFTEKVKEEHEREDEKAGLRNDAFFSSPSPVFEETR